MKTTITLFKKAATFIKVNPKSIHELVTVDPGTPFHIYVMKASSDISIPKTPGSSPI
jgi:hypothetical protein